MPPTLPDVKFLNHDQDLSNRFGGHAAGRWFNSETFDFPSLEYFLAVFEDHLSSLIATTPSEFIILEKVTKGNTQKISSEWLDRNSWGMVIPCRFFHPSCKHVSNFNLTNHTPSKMNMTLENPFEDVLRLEHGNVSSVMLVFKGVMFALPKTSTQIHSLRSGATCPVVAMRWPGASKGHVGRNNPRAPPSFSWDS